MLDFSKTLTLPSAARYLFWRASKRTGPIVVSTKLGPIFELRPERFGDLGNNDYGVAYEIFVIDLYKKAIDAIAREKTAFIVDLGANVGLSALRLLFAFPEAELLAFEPHPGHSRQAERNWSLSGVRDRARLIVAGAGTETRTAVLSDKGSGSTMSDGGSGIGIPIVDVFAEIGHRRIDLLKIDIEGAEYDIMADPRFEALPVNAIIMEWHDRGPGRNLEWCMRRLAAIGFKPEAYATEPHAGMVWAPRAS